MEQCGSSDAIKGGNAMEAWKMIQDKIDQDDNCSQATASAK